MHKSQVIPRLRSGLSPGASHKSQLKNRTKLLNGKRNSSRGFSFVDLCISIAVLAVVAGLFAPVIAQGIDAMLISRAQAQLSQEARLAMNFILGKMRDECCFTNTMSEWTSTKVVFLNTANNRYVGFNYNASNQHLEYLSGPTVDNLTAYTLVENVITPVAPLFLFKYFPRYSGTFFTAGAADASDPTLVKVFQVSFTLGTQLGTPLETRFELLSRVYLEHKPD
jgi:type II secretory pathway pseudopilin PulG